MQSRQRGVCDAYRGETRVESECERGDGLVFVFRRTHCVPADIYMYSRQPTRCVAAWTERDQAGSQLTVQLNKSVYSLLLRRQSTNVTLPAFAAERRRLLHGARSAPAAVDRYPLPARPYSCKPDAVACSGR